jgi:hypothetical protein
MKTKIKSIIVVAGIILSSVAHAQITGGGASGSSNNSSGDQKNRGVFYFSLAMPTGDFSDVNNGAAKTGFKLGYDYLYNVNVPDFKLLWSQALGYNSAAYSDYKWGYVSLLEDVGFRVEHDVNTFKIYGMLYGGLQMSYLTGDLDKYDMGLAFNYGVGAGMIYKHLNVGLRYNSCKTKFTYKDDSDRDFTQKMPTLDLTVGFEF